MKNQKYIATAILALAIATSGCGSKTKETADATVDTVQIVTQAQENMQNLTSYGFTMDMTSDTDMGKAGKMSMFMKTKSSVQTTPEILMKMESDISVTTPGIDPIQSHLLQYIQGSDENVTLYQNPNGVWSKMVVVDPETMKSLTGGATMGFAEYVESAEVAGDETIGEIPCQKIDVVLSAEGISQLLGEMGGMASTTGMDAQTPEETQELMKKAGDIPITLWIGKEDNQIYRQKIDMSKLMKEVMISSMTKEKSEGGEATETQDPEVTMILDITFHSLNAIEPITIPEDVKNAPEMQL